MKIPHLIYIAVATMLCVCGAFDAAAQRHYKPHVHVGVHGGMSMSRTSFYPSVKEQMLNGFQAGVSFRYAEERHVGLLAELNLTQRGWKEDLRETSLEYHRRLTYIELPVMTHIFFGSRVVKGFFNLGPQIGYMISDGITANFDYSNIGSVAQWPENHRTEQLDMKISRRFDYGITAGLGGEFYLNPRHSVNIEARFYYGLGNIFPAKVSDTFSASRCMNLELTLGYWFRLK